MYHPLQTLAALETYQLFTGETNGLTTSTLLSPQVLGTNQGTYALHIATDRK
jgi:hypothetical protein